MKPVSIQLTEGDDHSPSLDLNSPIKSLEDVGFVPDQDSLVDDDLDSVEISIEDLTTKTSSTSAIFIAIISYSLCSSSLLLLNKIVLTFFPFPSYVTTFQFAFAIITITGMQFLDFVQIKKIDGEILKSYGIYVLLFMSGIYANMRALETSNVETVIVARACTPLIVSFLDYQFMGRTKPSLKSFASMLAIVMGAFYYVMNDDKFHSTGASSYNWALTYMGLIALEMTFGKHVKNKVETTLWESVYFTNFMSVVPMLLWATMMGEYEKEMEPDKSVNAGLVFLVLSSIVGVGIGYSSWNARSLVSATSFTLVGVVNKFLTILVNLLIWDKHANMKGIVGLLVCLGGATFYRQAPKRSETKYHTVSNSDQDLHTEPKG